MSPATSKYHGRRSHPFWTSSRTSRRWAMMVVGGCNVGAWPETSVLQIIGQFDSFWSVLEDIDAHCWVIEPDHATRASRSRRIAIGQHCSILVDIEPESPFRVCDCRFLGAHDVSFVPYQQLTGYPRCRISRQPVAGEIESRPGPLGHVQNASREPGTHPEHFVPWETRSRGARRIPAGMRHLLLGVSRRGMCAWPTPSGSFPTLA